MENININYIGGRLGFLTNKQRYMIPSIATGIYWGSDATEAARNMDAATILLSTFSILGTESVRLTEIFTVALCDLRLGTYRDEAIPYMQHGLVWLYEQGHVEIKLDESGAGNDIVTWNETLIDAVINSGMTTVGLKREVSFSQQQ